MFYSSLNSPLIYDAAGEFDFLKIPLLWQGGDSVVKRPASEAGVVEMTAHVPPPLIFCRDLREGFGMKKEEGKNRQAGRKRVAEFFSREGKGEFIRRVHGEVLGGKSKKEKVGRILAITEYSHTPFLWVREAGQA